jgi:hypothetical protein
MSAPREDGPFATVAARSRRDLLMALLTGTSLMAAVPITLAIVEQDPLASGGCFSGDLVRGLMEVSGHFWSRHQRLYERYVQALRAAAGARRLLPREQRMEFWSSLTTAEIQRVLASEAEAPRET